VLTAKTQYNFTNSREYFEEHLCVGDYYDEGQRVAGQWIGAGAEQLGLSGKVRADDFLRFCENQHPATGVSSKPRQLQSCPSLKGLIIQFGGKVRAIKRQYPQQIEDNLSDKTAFDTGSDANRLKSGMNSFYIEL